MQQNGNPPQGEVSEVGAREGAQVEEVTVTGQDGRPWKMLVSGDKVVALYDGDGRNLTPAAEEGPHLDDPELAGRKRAAWDEYQALIDSLPVTADVPQTGENG